MPIRRRSRVEIGPDRLYLRPPDGRTREVELVGAESTVGDATFLQRFVRHIHLAIAETALDLVTPPEHGSIAPRAALLPRAPDEAEVLEPSVFEVLADWLLMGGRLDGRTIEELAPLARIATPSFAIVIGERAGMIAAERLWPFGGPMRGGPVGDDVRRQLLPLERAARDSERVHDAYIAALAASTRS